MTVTATVAKPGSRLQPIAAGQQVIVRDMFGENAQAECLSCDGITTVLRYDNSGRTGRMPRKKVRLATADHVRECERRQWMRDLGLTAKDMGTPEAADMMRHIAVQRVATGYDYTVIHRDAYRVSIQVTHRQQPERSYVVTHTYGRWHCTCPSWTEHAGCKHDGSCQYRRELDSVLGVIKPPVCSPVAPGDW